MRPDVREWLRSRTGRLVVAVASVLVIAGAGTAIVLPSDTIRVRSQFVTGTPEAGAPVRLDTSLYLPASTPAPAVLLSQGFGGDKSGLDSEAETFARHGFVVLTYSARGFGRSGGLIHFASPQYEVNDGRLLVSWLARQPQVERVAGQPQIAAAGSSYGGGLSLLLAAADHRVRAVAADITWNNLETAFFPNADGDGPGVFKKLWLGELFGNGFGSDPATSSPSCGRFAPSVCAAYQASAVTGRPTAALLRIMSAASPSSVLSKIDAPTLLTQGEQDSLFPLSQADANARGIAAHGTPVRVEWRPGGHDDSSQGTGIATSAAISWFDSVFHGGPDGAGVRGRQPFTFAEQAGVVSAETGNASQLMLRAAGYPGIDAPSQPTRTVRLHASPQVIAAPAGGVPAVITSIPGLGGLTAQLGSFSTLSLAPGQTAQFASPPLAHDVRVVGSSTVRLLVTAHEAGDAVLYAGLRDVSSDGTSTLPSQLVTPLRIPAMQAGQTRTVALALPPIVRNVLAGHHLVLTVSTTDFAYDNPVTPRTYTVGLAADAVSVPTLSGTAISAGHPLVWLLAGLAVSLLVAAVVTIVLLRRRLMLRPDPELIDVPVSIRGLVKEYRGGYRAVDGIDVRVERGQVVGLLGPNGAGKTTALRVLVGLITPTAGEVHVFGQPVTPGAAVLARLGSFIEGPGFLPHLTGRENLRLYWAATGRPESEAEFETALDIAGLGASIDRRVKAYSQGMRQRLGIAQAMLGLPEVLVLDEPTNGLDPPQIAEMREVLRQYAETGRTVIVSSHLLGEVEQTCTDVVVMHRGRVVAAGSVGEIAGTGGRQLAVVDPDAAIAVLAAAGISAETVPARRALEDVFLELVGGSQ